MVLWSLAWWVQDMNVLSEIFQTGRDLLTIIKLLSGKAEERGSTSFWPLHLDFESS